MSFAKQGDVSQATANNAHVDVWTKNLFAMETWNGQFFLEKKWWFFETIADCRGNNYIIIWTTVSGLLIVLF